MKLLNLALVAALSLATLPAFAAVTNVGLGAKQAEVAKMEQAKAEKKAKKHHKMKKAHHKAAKAAKKEEAKAAPAAK